MSKKDKKAEAAAKAAEAVENSDATKEATVKDAQEKAAEGDQSKEALEALMVEEGYKLESGEQHSVQQLMAYARQAKKRK